mgnify:FL=1
MSKLPILAAALAATAVLIASFAVDAAHSAAGDTAVPAAERAPLPLPRLRIDYSAQTGARLSGTVPDEAEHQALLRRARAVYGAERVPDELTVAAVGNPAWLSPAFLPDLRGATQASAVLSDAQLVIDGDAATEQARRLLAGQVMAFADYGLRIDNRVAVR